MCLLAGTGLPCSRWCRPGVADSGGAVAGLLADKGNDVRRTIQAVLATSISVCALAQVVVPTDLVPGTIVVERAVHFFAAEGEPTTVPPGTYFVTGDGTRIDLLDLGTAASYVLSASPGSHDEPVDQATAIAITDEELPDEFTVVLALPDNTELSATGTYSGVQARGFREDQAKRRLQRRAEAVRRQIAVKRAMESAAEEARRRAEQILGRGEQADAKSVE